MEKEEILEKSRTENRNRDIYEQEVLKQANAVAVIVMIVLAVIFFAVQIFTGGGENWGIWALVFSVNMTTFWVKSWVILKTRSTTRKRTRKRPK